MAKKTFEQWIKGKYESRGTYWISVHEKVVIGFAEKDLCHYSDKHVMGRYNRYVNYTSKK